MNIVSIKNLMHSYARYGEDGKKIGESTAVRDVSLEIEKGSFVAVLGHNGSGKSTLARHLNCLLLPDSGVVHIREMDTRDESLLWEIRRTAGMVFQNPDNQIVANVIEEDVAFGPENMGVSPDEIWQRVQDSLRKVGMYAYRTKSPNKLSGGQKQRIAIAGIMAMKPEVIVLDEPTAMLDPIGRREVIRTVQELNRKEQVTVVLITHYMEEAALADRIIVMDQGSVILDGTPREIFSQSRVLKAHGLDVPQVTELACRLQEDGIPLPDGILTAEEFTDAILKLCGGADGQKPAHKGGSYVNQA